MNLWCETLVAEAEGLLQEADSYLFLPHACDGYERVALLAVDHTKGLHVRAESHQLERPNTVDTYHQEEEATRWVGWEEMRRLADDRFGGHLPRALPQSHVHQMLTCADNLGSLKYFHEAHLLEGIRVSVMQGRSCQRCGPTVVGFEKGKGKDSPQGRVPSFHTSPSMWTSPSSASLSTWQHSLDERWSPNGGTSPHPCDALHAAFYALHSRAGNAHQCLVLLGGFSGANDTRSQMLRVLFQHYQADAPVLVRRISAAISLLSSLLVLEDAALLSSPLKISFSIDLQTPPEGQDHDSTRLTGTLTGAALDIFMIERDPAKYDALRDALASASGTETLGMDGVEAGGPYPISLGTLYSSTSHTYTNALGGGNPPSPMPVNGASLSATALKDLDLSDLSSSLSLPLQNPQLWTETKDEKKGDKTFEALWSSFQAVGVGKSDAVSVLRAMAASIVLSKASAPLPLSLYWTFELLNFPRKLTKVEIQRVGASERDLKQLAREAFTLAIQELVGLLNTALSSNNPSPSSLAAPQSPSPSTEPRILSILNLPAPTLNHNLGRFSDLAAALAVIQTMTQIGPHLAEDYRANPSQATTGTTPEGGKEKQEMCEKKTSGKAEAAAISSTEEAESHAKSSSGRSPENSGSMDSNSGTEKRKECRGVKNFPGPAQGPGEIVNSAVESVYGLVAAVNRATLARVAENKVERELKASLRLGKTDDVTLPWGKTLLAKPLIRLNAAMLPPDLAQLVGCQRRWSGKEAATVLDGLIAWVDRAVGKSGDRTDTSGTHASQEKGTERMEDHGQATGAGEVGDSGEGAGTRACGGEREGAREEATGEGEVGDQAMEEIGEVASKARAPPTPARTPAFHLICDLKTHSSPTTFDGIKVLQQIRLYQLDTLAQGFPFVGPSPNPVFSTSFISQRILSGGDGGPGAHGGNPLLRGKNQQLFPGLNSVTRSRLSAYMSPAQSTGKVSTGAPVPARVSRTGGPNMSCARTHAGPLPGILPANQPDTRNRLGSVAAPAFPPMDGRARISAKDSTFATNHGHMQYQQPSNPAQPTPGYLQEECWALRRRNQELTALSMELAEMVTGPSGRHQSTNTSEQGLFPGVGEGSGKGREGDARSLSEVQAKVMEVRASVYETLDKFTKVIWDTFGFDVRKEGVVRLRHLRHEIVGHLDALIAQEESLRGLWEHAEGIYRMEEEAGSCFSALHAEQPPILVPGPVSRGIGKPQHGHFPHRHPIYAPQNLSSFPPPLSQHNTHRYPSLPHPQGLRSLAPAYADLHAHQGP
ncbi:hypothetical protein Naga_100290g6 [Nannochloropsis gaditana]|uniref:Uncharacterized protein n=1 Tax=Nannochloropsis gaditana TaxID=72520 RepID=W7TPA3_9STRA|nr:hypothetical protein Naga_100290g6 [Nannochloropsis gaditana]